MHWTRLRIGLDCVLDLTVYTIVFNAILDEQRLSYLIVVIEVQIHVPKKKLLKHYSLQGEKLLNEE